MILNIYKPRGWTSFDVVAKVRNFTNIRKVGHAGTLDPLAEGVLLVLTEKDTKKQDTFKDLSKEYLAYIALGAYSPSFDLEILPVIKEIPNTYWQKNELPKLLVEFTKQNIGAIVQQVPIYSAVKKSGKRLYKLARKGMKPESIEMPKRSVTIYGMKVEEFGTIGVTTDRGEVELPFLLVRISCSSGTYIRSIAHELGEYLGTGAVLVKLIRTKIGEYSVQDSIRMSDFLSQQLLSQTLKS